MPGVLELAQDVLRNNVRIAKPDYIGVREPQYSTGVGLIQFAYEHARIQGRNIGTTVTVDAPEKRVNKQQPEKNKSKSNDQNIGKKVKRFFGYFFE